MAEMRTKIKRQEEELKKTEAENERLRNDPLADEENDDSMSEGAADAEDPETTQNMRKQNLEAVEGALSMTLDKETAAFLEQRRDELKKSVERNKPIDAKYAIGSRRLRQLEKKTVDQGDPR